MAQINASGYASRAKELLGLINQLHALGAQSEIDLPRITVIGNQSAGKSSVVEAISGINVPRDAGTCTRCPMECRLTSSNGPWQCRISIRREFDNKQRRLDDIREVPFGEVITKKADVELALRRAQLSVLNPGIPTAKILSATPAEMSEWSAQSTEKNPFSKNVVCVDLEGPELTDLSFIDLPGLIANADNEIVQLVEDMVNSHIKGNCLILVALPMTDDIENQKALKLARTQDPTGRRTIGVMTKPDMLPAGATKALDLWLDVVEGRRHPLAHGYYCTRQPDDRDRSENITAAKARAAEKEFFNSTLPWSRSTSSERFGTDRLISSLSQLLVRIIDETLPNIRTEAMQSLENCRRELAKIPPAVNEEPATHVLKLVTEFATDVRTLVKGRSDASTLIQENRAAFRKLKIDIRTTAPNFVPALSKDTNQPASILYLEDEDEDLRLVVERPNSRFTLTHMRDHINRSITRELPNNVPFEAKAALMVQFQATWRKAVEQCFTRVETNLGKVLFQHVDERFSRYVVLHGHMKSFIAELMSKRRAACQQILDATLETEQMPYTQNTHYLETTTEKWLSKYKDIRAGKVNVVEPVPKRSKVQTPPPMPAQSQSSGALFGKGTAQAPFVIESPAGGKVSSNPSVQSNGFASKDGPNGAFSGGAFGSFGMPNTDNNGNGFGNNSGPNTFAAAFAASSQGNGNIAPAPKGFAFNAPAQTSAFPAAAPHPPLPKATQTQKTTFQVPEPVAVTTHDPEKVRDALALLAGLGYNVTEEDLGKLNPSDEYEVELKVMAEVRGYFQVAYKRVIDMIPQFIDAVFLRSIAQELQSFLIEKFGLGTAAASERCGKYLMEDGGVVARRDELLGRERRLTSVQQQLISFGVASLEEEEGMAM